LIWLFVTLSPARLYYLNFGSFDTRVSQGGAHSGLFNQLGDAVMAFLRDLKLKMTTDFRSVYATMIKEWMGYEDTKTILKGDFPTLGLFA
jgi:uncharacterized protein (DUF1501 family)